MFTAIAMLALFLVIAVLMFLRKLPTLLALPLLAIGLALIAGVPLTGKSADGKDIGLISNIIESGAIRLASAYTAVIFGAWLGQIMNQTGIARRIIKLAAELGGDKPFWIALAVLVALTLLFTTMSGLGAVIMLGTIVVPILISVGIAPITAGCVFLFGMASGLAMNVTNWQFYLNTTGVAREDVQTFALIMTVITFVMGVVFLVVEFRRQGLKAFWAAPSGKAQPAADVKVNILALLTPIVPLVLILALKWTIIPALLVGIFYALITTWKGWTNFINTMTKAAFDGVADGAPAVILMIGIGMVLNAVFHPTVSATLGPLLKAVVPTNTIGYILFFVLLAPLALYRGPLNMFGLGSGVAGLLIGMKILPATAVMGAMLSTERMQVIGDPTNTHNVWMAGYTSSDVNAITMKVVPYLWTLTLIGVIVSSVMFM